MLPESPAPLIYAALAILTSVFGLLLATGGLRLNIGRLLSREEMPVTFWIVMTVVIATDIWSIGNLSLMLLRLVGW